MGENSSRSRGADRDGHGHTGADGGGWGRTGADEGGRGGQMPDGVKIGTFYQKTHMRSGRGGVRTAKRRTLDGEKPYLGRGVWDPVFKKRT